MELKTLFGLAAIVRSRQDKWLQKRPSAPLHDRAEGVRATRDELRRKRRLHRSLGTATLLGAACLAGLVLWPRRTAFEVGTSRTPGVTGLWLSTPPNQEIPLYFHDGSHLVLLDDARFQVEHVEPAGAQIVVEKGKVRASVVPRSEGKWLVIVGPFRVHVRGTQFDASWDPDSRTFLLRMRKGAVDVRGGCLEAPRTAANHESLEVVCPIDLPARTLATPANATATAPASSVPAASGPVTSASAPDEGLGSAPSSVRDSWRELLREHNGRGAIERLEADGTFDSTCASASLPDLMALADAARHARRTALAAQAYEAIRRRYGGSEAAANSAFHLGRLAVGQGRLQPARMWLFTYLAERPRGPLAQEAWGRALEIDRADPLQGKETARSYLARFPNGPHASLARSLLPRAEEVEAGPTP
ncbi:MAG: FecR domain-containing protein [Polyangiaceae bacterium]|jgi:hypothetical protein|nr:FecR domain-containing protein [Polyangiaceae bacterium]